MLFKSLIGKIPYVGNLLPVVYVSVSKLGPKFSKKIPAKSVIVNDGRKPGKFGLVISESELREANFRYVKYIDSLSPDDKNLRLGHIKKVTVSIIKLRKLVDTEYWLVHLNDNLMPRQGYLFTLSGMNDIAARTDRIKRTVKRPNLFQRLILKIWKIFGARLELEV